MWNFSSFSLNESNLSLIARKAMRLLVNHQPFPLRIRPKSISFEKSCYERSEVIAVTSLYCLLFSTSINKDLKRISKSASNVSIRFEIFLDLKVCSSLVTYKINNLIALRSANRITEISALWWLRQKHCTTHSLIYLTEKIVIISLDHTPQ